MIICEYTKDGIVEIDSDTISVPNLLEKKYFVGRDFRVEVMRRIFYLYYDPENLTEINRIQGVFDEYGSSFMALLDNNDLSNAIYRVGILKDEAKITEADKVKILAILDPS